MILTMINNIKNFSIKVGGFAIMLLMCFSLTNCDDLLDAANPNNLVEEQLDDFRAFGPMVNGLEATVVRAYGNILAPYSTASDEMIWTGSRDAWQQLNFGNIADPLNEFTDAAFPFVGEARWWGDEVISRGEAFGDLVQAEDMGRAYLYTAFTYIMIADMFDDFVITSNKREAGSPVGPGNMNTLYDAAIGYLNKGLALSASDDLKTALTGMKARAQFAKGLWAKVNPVNTSDPLVSSSEAAATALSAIGMMGGVTSDYKWRLETDPGAPGTVGGLDIAGEVNSRLEMRLSAEYIIPDAAGTRVASLDDGDPATSISLMDPIDGIPAPALYTNVKEFTDAFQFPDYPVVTAREMHLILAENDLANGNMAGFTTHINHIRALDGLTDYSGQVDATDLLHHTRRTNLFLSGRRITDHYRFDAPSVYWLDNTDATSSPGTFFPITITEIQANPNIN
jgi:hypothetical protein